MKKLNNWKQKSGSNRIRHHRNWNCHLDRTPITGCTGSCHANKLKCSQWWNQWKWRHFCFSGYPSRFYLTHRCFSLMTHITVWDGAVNTIHIQIVLFYGGRETIDTMGCYFLDNIQWCAINQDGYVISQRVVSVFCFRYFYSRMILLSCIVAMMCALRFYVTGREIGRKGTLCVFVI